MKRHGFLPLLLLAFLPVRQASAQSPAPAAAPLSGIAAGDTLELPDHSLTFVTYTYVEAFMRGKQRGDICLTLQYPAAGNDPLRQAVGEWIADRLTALTFLHASSPANVVLSPDGDADGAALLSAKARQVAEEVKSGAGGTEAKEARAVSGLTWTAGLMAEGKDFVTLRATGLCYGDTLAFSTATFRKHDGKVFEKGDLFVHPENVEILINQACARQGIATRLGDYAFYPHNTIGTPYCEVALASDSIHFLYHPYQPADSAAVRQPATAVAVSLQDLLPHVNQQAKAMMTDELGEIVQAPFTFFVGKGCATLLHCQQDAADIRIPAQITSDGWTYAVTAIASRAFTGTGGVSSVSVPSSVTSIAPRAFAGCPDLTEVELPDRPQFTSLPAGCFAACPKLQQIQVSEGIDSLGNSCFEGCEQLSNIILPSTLSHIGDSCFAHTSLVTVNLPQSLRKVGAHAFGGCRRLQFVSLPAQLAALGSHAFENCGELQHISLPEGLTDLGSHAFAGCGKLSGTISVPPAITILGDSLFSDCGLLQRVTMGRGVVSIGTGSLLHCFSLDSLFLPDRVAAVGPSAFSGCKGLRYVRFPEGLAEMGDACFEDCTSLTSIFLPSTLSAMGDHCFSGCTQLAEVTCPWMSPAETQLGGEEVWKGISAEAVLFIPKGAKKFYKDKSPWTAFDKMKRIKDQEKVVVRPTQEAK